MAEIVKLHRKHNFNQLKKQLVKTGYINRGKGVQFFSIRIKFIGHLKFVQIRGEAVDLLPCLLEAFGEFLWEDA